MIANSPMSLDDPTETTGPARGSVCVVIVQAGGEEPLHRCAESVRRHTPHDTMVVGVAASAGAVNDALAQLAPADVVLLGEPSEVTAGWLERMREAARADTNTASASALATAGTALSLSDPDESPRALEHAERSLAEQTLRLRPRLNTIVGPCVYVRREALEL